MSFSFSSSSSSSSSSSKVSYYSYTSCKKGGDGILQTETGQRLRAGDIIRIERGSYQHCAIYIGNGKIVELVGVILLTGIGSIRKMDLEAVVGNDDWDIDNYLDGEYTPYDRGTIVDRAVGEIGPAYYNTLLRNCEHFATWCRYGVSKCKQI